jgi:hypothetical protein
MEHPIMNKINYTEYESLKSFDQALVWAIIRLREANQHPDNKDLLDYVTIRPEARDFIRWSTQLDDQGQPFFTASLLFPLGEQNPLVSRAIPANIPNYTNFELPIQPMSIPATGRGLPLPEIPPQIDTLERLTCWLCLIGHQAGEFIGYINAINIYAMITQTIATRPNFSLTPAGLGFEKIFSFAAITAATRGSSGGGGGGSTAADAFQAFETTPQTPNNADLSERLEEFRENSRSSSEPPQVDPGKGYERIDTLPVCKDQDPSIKAFNTPLAKLLK